MKPLAEMNLIDNFLFWAVLSHEEYGPEAAKTILEAILQRTIGSVKVHAQKVLYGADSNMHGIRMDAYITEEHPGELAGEVFDIEPDRGRSKKAELPFRTRYYHALTDTYALEAGKKYSHLPVSYVMMITDYDPFDRNRMVYTIMNQCLEEPDMPYYDGQCTLYLYVDGDQTGAPEELANMLQYMKSSTNEKAVDAKLKALQAMVEAVKASKEVQKSYMTFQDLLDQEVEEELEKKLEKELEKARKEVRDEESRKRLEAEQRATLRVEQEKMRAELAEQRADAERQRAQDLQKELDRLKKLLTSVQ